MTTKQKREEYQREQARKITEHRLKGHTVQSTCEHLNITISTYYLYLRRYGGDDIGINNTSLATRHNINKPNTTAITPRQKRKQQSNNNNINTIHQQQTINPSTIGQLPDMSVATPTTIDIDAFNLALDAASKRLITAAKKDIDEMVYQNDPRHHRRASKTNDAR